MWQSIQINKQNIKAESERSVLIQMPHNSDFDGYSFWHPSKLVRDGKHNNAVSISYTDEFEFRLKKYNKNKQVISEETIDVEEFESAFEVMDKNIIAPKEDSYLKVEEPTKIDKEVEVVECLKNN